MKKFFFFLLLLPLIGCNAFPKKDKNLVVFDCPSVFFSSEDNIYVDAQEDNISIDNLSIKAELNNIAINTSCMQSNNIIIIPIDILIIVKPLDEFLVSEVEIPLYVSLLDLNDNLLETQYFNISGVISKNEDQKKFIETDIIDTLTVITKNYNMKQLVIGFMLDNKKRKLLD